MKLVTSLLTLIIIFNGQISCSDVNLPVDHETPKTVIHYFGEAIRNINKTGDSLDPIEFDRVEINLPGEMFGFSVNITKGSISGLSNCQLINIEVSSTEPKIEFHILFPLLKFYSEYYELDGHIYYVVPIGGKGIAHFEIHNAQFKGTLYLKDGPNSHSIFLDKLEDAQYNIERILSFTEFDQNIDIVISAIVEDLLAVYLNRFNKFILITYSDTVIQYINNIIQKIEENQLLSILSYN